MSDENESALPAPEQRAILAWLDLIGETDSATRREMLRRAAYEPRAREYLLNQAASLQVHGGSGEALMPATDGDPQR